MEKQAMEEKTINKLREDKKLLKEIYEYVKGYIDIESEALSDSYTLKTLSKISKIDEDITDIIYELLDNKKS